MQEFYNEDCMDGMKRYPDKYFDLAIVDPPYGIGFDGQKANVKHNFIEHKQKDWDRFIPPKEYFKELFRVSKNQIVWGGNYFLKFLFNTPCFLMWNKIQEFSGAEFEMAWTSFKSPSKEFRMSRVEAYTHQTKIHPTQKPIALYKWLIKNYAKEGYKILDTHVGSASSLIAFESFGLDYVGFEIDKEYYEKAKDRIEKEREQLKLFAPSFA
jgi:site-specific DNA-methyltransferase (adenine-specific)